MTEARGTPKKGQPQDGSSKRPSEKSGLNAGLIKRRVEALAQMQDKKKAANVRRRLLIKLLTGIADGSVRDPAKAAEAFLAATTKKSAAPED